MPYTAIEVGLSSSVGMQTHERIKIKNWYIYLDGQWLLFCPCAVDNKFCYFSNIILLATSVKFNCLKKRRNRTLF